MAVQQWQQALVGIDGQCLLALACCTISRIDKYDGSDIVTKSKAV